MPNVGQKYQRKPHKLFGARDSDNSPLVSNPYTVTNDRKSVQGSPEQAVNRTSKSDKSDKQSTHYKNQRHDPVPRIQGSDDSRSLQHVLNPRRKQRV